MPYDTIFYDIIMMILIVNIVYIKYLAILYGMLNDNNEYIRIFVIFILSYILIHSFSVYILIVASCLANLYLNLQIYDMKKDDRYNTNTQFPNLKVAFSQCYNKLISTIDFV